MRAQAPIVVDKFGGSVLTRPEDIAAAVDVVVGQRAAGLRPVVVVSAFEGVTDAILGSAAVLLPDGGASLRGDAAHAAESSLARETDRALATGEALSAALESKDAYTAEHSRAIADDAVAVGAMLGLEGEELRMLRYAATLHDIGKIGVRREILTKDGPLDEAERAEVEEHSLIGERIIEPVEFLSPIRPIVRQRLV